MDSANLTIDTSHVLPEPARGGVAYPGLAALPGVEQLGAFLAGRAPAPPVARLTGDVGWLCDVRSLGDRLDARSEGVRAPGRARFPRRRITDCNGHIGTPVARSLHNRGALHDLPAPGFFRGKRDHGPRSALAFGCADGPG